jgi:hypothetical protein
MIKYHPYKSDKPHKKMLRIITNENKKIYFGQASASDFTIHKDEARKQRYINRHKKKESKFWNKSGFYTPLFWSFLLLWNDALESTNNKCKLSRY